MPRGKKTAAAPPPEEMFDGMCVQTCGAFDAATKKELKKAVEEHGGKFTAAARFAKSTTHVIVPVADGSVTGAVIDAATEGEIPVLDMKFITDCVAAGKLVATKK